MASAGARPPWTLTAAATLVAAACLIPAGYLVVRSLGAGAKGLGLLLRFQTVELLITSLGLALAVSATTVVLGVSLAWLTARTDLPGRRIWTVVFAAPLAIPSYVGAYVFVAAFGTGGVFHGLAASVGLGGRDLVYGFVPSWLVLSLLTFPYVFLTVRAALTRTPPALEEAARTLGASPGETFRRVIWPQVRPAAGAGGLLVALYVLSDFGAVSILRCSTFTEVIYNQYTSAFDRTSAAVNALLLVVVCVVLVALEQRARGSHALHQRRGRGTRRPPRLLLGRWRPAALASSAAVATASVGIPVVVLVTWAARRGDPTVARPDVLSLGWSSVEVSLGAALVCAVAAIPVAYLAARRRGLIATTAERSTYVGYALPGVVIALALVSAAVRVSWLYQTIPLLVFAYAVHFLPQAVGSTRTAVAQVTPELEETARLLGRRPFAAFVQVVLPLILPGVAAGAALVFLTAMKELPATLILAPPDFQTLATSIWSLTEDGLFAHAAWPALALLVFAGAPTLMLLLAGRSRAGWGG